MSKISSGMKSLFEIAKNKFDGVDQHVTEEIREVRMKICEECPKLIKITGNCGECGCFVKIKTKYKQEECPLNKWNKEV